MNNRKISLSLNHDRSTQDYSSLSRLVFLIIIVFFLGLVLFIQACDPIAATKEKGKYDKDEFGALPGEATHRFVRSGQNRNSHLCAGLILGS